ncbi:hypothetical protein JCM10207_005717 [Rhodosporidiobolus poonsookiae]
MVHFSTLLFPLAAAASLTFAHAAPPNPDQLYVLQESAESVADAAPTGTAHHHAHGGRHPREHLHHRRAAAGMQRRPASERRAPSQVQLGGRKEDVRERERRAAPRKSRQDRRGVVDSSATPDDAADESDLAPRGDVEPRAGEQYYLASGDAAATAGSSTRASRTAWGVTADKTAVSSAAAAASSAASSPSKADDIAGAWRGVSSYYLFALDDGDRAQVLDAVKGAGFKVIRIFVASVLGNNKGSGNAAVNDLEHGGVGVYDDTILTKIDQLMVECQARGLKLLIALSDRYALGFWSTDSYALKLNIVKSGSSGAQKVANAAAFYTRDDAISAFDARLKHIMAHKNAQLGKTWAELDDVIYAVEPQNEPQGHMSMASSTWACDRAKVLKNLIPSSSNIKVSTGGGITTTDSLGSWATGCSAFDIISVHDYGTSASTTANALAAAQDAHPDKTVIMGEWGASGSNKAAIISSFVTAFNAKAIPQMYWQITKPGAGAKDFEVRSLPFSLSLLALESDSLAVRARQVWTNEDAWTALTGGKTYGYVAATTTPVAKSSTTAQWHAATSSWSSATAKASSKAADVAGDAKDAVTSAAAAATSKAAEGAQSVKSAAGLSDDADKAAAAKKD